MIKWFAVLVVVLVSLASVAAQEVPGVPTNGTWVKIQDGEVTQWSAVSAAQPWTRVDFLSQVEDGERTMFYMVRTRCSADRFSVAVIKAGNVVGIGKDCDGALVLMYDTVLSRVQKLPAEVLDFLKP